MSISVGGAKTLCLLHTFALSLRSRSVAEGGTP